MTGGSDNFQLKEIIAVSPGVNVFPFEIKTCGQEEYKVSETRSKNFANDH